MDKDVKYILNHPKYSSILKRAIYNPIKEEVLSNVRDRLFTDFLTILEEEFYRPMLRYFYTGDDKYLPKKNIQGINIVKLIDEIEDLSSSYDFYDSEDSEDFEKEEDLAPHKKFDYEIESITEILKIINNLKKEELPDVITVEKDIFKDQIVKSIEKRIRKNKDEYFKKCKFIKKEYGCDNFDAINFVKGTIRIKLNSLDNLNEAGSFIDKAHFTNSKVDSYLALNSKRYLSIFFDKIQTRPININIFNEMINFIFTMFSGTVFHELYHFCQTYLLKYGIKFGFSKSPKNKEKKELNKKDLIEEKSLDSKDYNIYGRKEKLEKNININKEAYYTFLKIKEDISQYLDPYEQSLPIILKRKNEFNKIKSDAGEENYFDLSSRVFIKIGLRYREIKYKAFMFDEKIYVHFDDVDSSPGNFTIKSYGPDKVDYQNIPLEKYPGLISYMSNLLSKLSYYIFMYQSSPEKIFDEDYFEENKKNLERMLSGQHNIDKVFKELEQDKKIRIKKYLKNFLVNVFPKYYIDWFELSDNSIINQFWTKPMIDGVMSRAKYLDLEVVDRWLEDNYDKALRNKNFFSKLIGNLNFSIYDLEYDFSDLIHKNVSKFIKENGSDILKTYILNTIIKGYKKEAPEEGHDSQKQSRIINKILNVDSIKVDNDTFEKIDEVINEQSYNVDKKTIFDVIKEIKPNQFFELELDEKYTKRFPKLTILMLKNLEKKDFEILGIRKKYNEEFLKENFQDEQIDEINKIIRSKSRDKTKKRSRIFKSWNK